MALGAHMRPYSYMYCTPHRDGVLHGARGRLARSGPNSDARSRMVLPIGGNVGDDKGCDEKVISTAMDAGCGFGDNRYGKDV